MLKKQIVIKNKFTIKRENTRKGQRKGSRGSRPGAFVVSYMSRDENEATDALMPLTDKEYEDRYDKQKEVVAFLRNRRQDADKTDLKDGLKAVDEHSGRAFGSGGLSMSDQRLREDSSKIQKAYEDKHAVQLTVLSFSHDFLKEHGVLDDDFDYQGPGSYVDNYDQMKLRLAITEGMDRLFDEGGYKDPVWVGVIQADTEHLHCHLAIADQEFSEERMVDNGYDRGRMNESEMSVLREGIEDRLELLADYTFHSKNHSKDKENVRLYAKDLDFQESSYKKNLQLIMSQLPEDKSLWSFESDDPEMLRANKLAEDFVESVKSDERETLTQLLENNVDNSFLAELDRLDNKDAVNRLYAKLSEVETSVDSSAVSVEASTDSELYERVRDKEDSGFDLATFEYNKRLFFERKEIYGERLIENVNSYIHFLQLKEEGRVTSRGMVFDDYYKTEILYNASLYEKYSGFDMGSSVDLESERLELDDLLSDPFLSDSERNQLNERVAKFKLKQFINEEVGHDELLESLSRFGSDNVDKKDNTFGFQKERYAYNVHELSEELLPYKIKTVDVLRQNYDMAQAADEMNRTRGENVVKVLQYLEDSGQTSQMEPFIDVFEEVKLQSSGDLERVPEMDSTSFKKLDKVISLDEDINVVETIMGDFERPSKSVKKKEDLGLEL